MKNWKKDQVFFKSKYDESKQGCKKAWNPGLEKIEKKLRVLNKNHLKLGVLFSFDMLSSKILNWDKKYTIKIKKFMSSSKFLIQKHIQSSLTVFLQLSYSTSTVFNLELSF